MPSIGSTGLIILLVVVLVLFGAKRLPDSARSLGRSMRILKAETEGLRGDDLTVPPEPLTVARPRPQPACRADRGTASAGRAARGGLAP